MTASFGDLVRIASTPMTQQAGIAGLVGSVCGETNPSVSGVTVIGGAQDDFALNVFCEASKESYWLTLDLVEFLDPQPGATPRLEGVAKGWVRQKTGKWRDADLPPTSLWRRLLARLRRHG